jgi:hypothetical protein
MPLFQRRPRRKADDARLGLVVGVRARQEFDPRTGRCIRDELQELEQSWLRGSRGDMTITFKESENDGPIPETTPTQTTR